MFSVRIENNPPQYRIESRGVAQLGLARLLGVQEVEGSNPSAPTIFKNEPFSQYIEGLTYCRDKTYTFELAVQTE